MDNIYIEATSDTPEVIFENSGKLSIKGRSLPENIIVFYDQLIDWVKKLKAETVRMDISLDYISSTSSKKLLEMLKILDANNTIKELIINWHYEYDDDDIIEKGQIFEELLMRASFRYYELSEKV